MAEGKQGEISTSSDVASGVETIAHLANDDAAGGNRLATVDLDAAILGIGIPPVLTAAAGFFVCHD